MLKSTKITLAAAMAVVFFIIGIWMIIDESTMDEQIRIIIVALCGGGCAWFTLYAIYQTFNFEPKPRKKS